MPDLSLPLRLLLGTHPYGGELGGLPNQNRLQTANQAP